MKKRIYLACKNYKMYGFKNARKRNKFIKNNKNSENVGYLLVDRKQFKMWRKFGYWYECEIDGHDIRSYLVRG